MKIVHLSTKESIGGAARGAQRIHKGLRNLGYDSMMFVSHRQSDDPNVYQYVHSRDPVSKIKRFIRSERIKAGIRPYRDVIGGYEMLSDDRTIYTNRFFDQLPPHDIIHLHWIADFVDYQHFFRTIPSDTPIFWTLRDMHPLTGICHYDGNCGRFTEQCGACPQLRSTEPHDLSHQVWKRKHNALAAVPTEQIHLIAPSHWMAAEARRSSLLSRFRVTVVPHGLDTQEFPPCDRDLAREKLDLPQNARIVLFVAQTVTNPRKGFKELYAALQGLTDVDNLLLVTLGKQGIGENLGIWTIDMGIINDNQMLSLIYSAADVFVIPSLQEVFGHTIIESMACGTPVIGFDTGGMSDLIQPGRTGALVPVSDVDALRTTLTDMLTDMPALAAMSDNCRQTVLEHYTIEKQSRRYGELYKAAFDSLTVPRNHPVTEVCKT
jgi:glycosyltransferase involved in cell wall biosynthesis